MSERKPVEAWQANPENEKPLRLFMLRAGKLTAYATSEGWWGIQTEESACDESAWLVRLASVGYEGHDNEREAKIAAEDALFAIADTINELRGKK